MRFLKENMDTYCKPRAIIKENADELLVVVTMSFQLDKQKITFDHMPPEEDLFLTVFFYKQ